CAVLHGALLDLRDFRRHADDDARTHPDVPVVSLLDEVGQHLLGDFEVSDDAVLHWLDGDDVAGRPAEHLFRVPANRLDAPVDFVDRNNRRLVDDDAFSAGVDAGIRGAEVDREIAGEQGEKRAESQVETPWADLKVDPYALLKVRPGVKTPE